jgi:hypothetical protein
MKREPPAIVEASFTHDGEQLARYGAEALEALVAVAAAKGAE